MIHPFSFVFLLLLNGSFTNYLDKARWVGGSGNVNGMQIFTSDSKGIISPMSTRVGRGSKKAKSCRRSFWTSLNESRFYRDQLQQYTIFKQERYEMDHEYLDSFEYFESSYLDQIIWIKLSRSKLSGSKYFEYCESFWIFLNQLIRINFLIKFIKARG